MRGQQVPENFRDAIDYPSLLTQLHSADVTERANAFYSLLFDPAKGEYDAAGRLKRLLVARPKLSAQIERTLVAALVSENRDAPARKTPLPALYAQYHPHLVSAVGVFTSVDAKAALNVAAKSTDARVALAAKAALTR